VEEDAWGGLLPHRLQLLALSFMALFLELMLIRWAPAVVPAIAYYANLLLISSFLGLGLGATLAPRGWRLFRAFPLLLLLEVGFLLLCREVAFGGSRGELRHFARAPELVNYGVAIGTFVLNAALFVPVGERIGELFQSMPPLRAYGWDLGGSLLGTLAFGVFSFLFFSPLWGLALVAALALMLGRGRQRLVAAPVLAITLGLMALNTERTAVWSPYYYITVHQAEAVDEGPIAAPPPVETDAIDPPVYTLKVNHFFYQHHGTIDPGRYSEPRLEYSHHSLPYVLRPSPESVLVLGAGGGMDVEAALLGGAGRVTAVEIDPGIVGLSERFNAARVYSDPRVDVVVDDARAFVQRDEGRYDVVAFGLLDSQALFSSMSNVRLDGFVYTVEGLRAAYERVADGGILALAFAAAGQGWLIHKLVEMVREATGRPPLVYTAGTRFVICSPRGETVALPAQHKEYRLESVGHVAQDLATDDWPYLYLRQRSVPRDYQIVIGVLLALSCLVLGGLVRRDLERQDGRFFFLGLGFLLLETKSILDCSLYFGATWLVTTLVVGGVLLMVLGANVLAQRRPDLDLRRQYLGLLASAVVVCVVPHTSVLELPIWGRVLWTLVVVPLPIFFAGVIFSISLRGVANPAVRLGANLLGATVGGFAEYLGMLVGHTGVSLVLIGAYLLSAAFRPRS
jgi:Spermine/spermidine synthase domain